MGREIFRASIENSFFFSFATFLVTGIAGFLYNLLEKTPGKINMGVLILIVLGIVLLMFLLALVNILMSEDTKAPGREKDAGKAPALATRLGAVVVFLLLSTAVLGTMFFLFWFEF